MAKKKRRTKARQTPRPQRPAHNRYGHNAAVQPSAPQKHSRVSSVARESADRYQHVIPELKRIGIIAGAVILALIILSLALV